MTIAETIIISLLSAHLGEIWRFMNKILKNKRKRPLYIKTKNGIYQSYYIKNGLHFCKGYHLILLQEVIAESYIKEDLID